ncbi:tetrapyrrole methylase [Radiomyces spectabilis]|uniref:tetrapyrrole methylase n=1 Tax=Radiomyces spectabilis TaxID=64574 RepID=UPI00221EC601|nr:tetrapyrrole methylase [Radiomyces spectabilis]KAI8368294.1 tetrapyrrole methylase [Radiomyces spectabilis]
MSFIPPPRVPQPQGGASLMIAFQCKRKHILVMGNNSIAASRVLASLEADATVTLVGSQQAMCSELLYRIQENQISWGGERLYPELLADKDLAFVCGFSSSYEVNQEIVRQCRTHRVPVNVTDMNDLCDFFMTSTYRDQSLQIAVSTNGQASKLSNRIRRHIAANLPSHLGDAINRVGILRRKVRKTDPSSAASSRRMKWLAQICEYWSMERLAQLSDQDMEDLLQDYQNDEGYESMEKLPSLCVPSPASIINKSASQGTISLVGSGPGDPGLLTVAAQEAMETADLVLADKIVPAEIVALVKCELKIARKFPGNADAAQEEFNQIALKALRQGKHVVRLKQGDPFLFGRGGEEVLFFRSHGYCPKVIPGISSSVAAPLLAGIPLTHRSVASQFLVTTGTGARNSAAPLPVYDEHRTDVFLMAIHRLEALTQDLLTKQKYPSDLPCAIVERASCADQRILWGQLDNIVQVLESVGGSRPPGLLVVGKAIHVLKHDHFQSTGVANNVMSGSGDSHSSSILQLHDPDAVF